MEDLSIPINKSNNVSSNMVMDNEELPRNISFETNRVNRAINQNKYEKHNYYDMVNNYNHLTVTHKSVLTNLFKKYKDLFSSKLGKVPGPPIDLKTFCVAAYSTSQLYMKIAK